MTIESTNPKLDANNPQIYVACLSSYNEGILHGLWIDADQEPDAIHEEIQQMLEESPAQGIAEEFAIHDYQGFGAARIGEYEALEDISALANLIAEHGEQLASKVWEHADRDLERARQYLEEDYQGSFSDLADWAEDYLDSIGQLREVPESLRQYIDFEAFARDAELGGDIFAIEDENWKVHVFWNH